MKTLTKIAALTIVAGGFLVAGMSSSADAGHCASSYGFNDHRPLLVTYPRVRVLCDAYGCHYFTDSYGIRHDVYATAFSNRYFYNYGGVQRFVLGY